MLGQVTGQPKPVVKRSRKGKKVETALAIQDVDAEADQKGMLLTKGFEYVHVSNNLSLVQRKMVNILLHNAYQNLLTAEEHRIHLSVLLELLGVQRNNIEYVKAAFRALLSIQLEWSILERDHEEKWSAATAVAQAEIKGDYAYYSYAPLLRKKLYNPRMGAIINLIVQNYFTSNYSLALYENVLRYREDGMTVWFPMDIFKQLLGATSKSYEEFKVFNKAVLTPAIKEVNAVSNIHLEPEFQREKRKICAVRFILTPGNQALLDLRGGGVEESAFYPAELVAKMRDFGINEERAKTLAITYSDEQINNALAYVEHRVTNGKLKTDAVTGYAVKAIQGGWAKEETKFDRAKREQAAEQEEYQKKIDAAEKLVGEARNAFSLYRESRLNDILQTLTEEQRDSLQSEFISGLMMYEKNLLKKMDSTHPLYAIGLRHQWQSVSWLIKSSVISTHFLKNGKKAIKTNSPI